jgi:hypothetical protein
MQPAKGTAPAAGHAPAGQEPSGPSWRKARSSGAENGGCVEIAGGSAGLTGIRDSLRPDDGAHFVSTGAFAEFLADAKAGAYDIEPQ